MVNVHFFKSTVNYNNTIDWNGQSETIETVPTNLIAKMFHFKKVEFFKVEEAEKAKVTIQF